jgi:enoyl-CoA hydratase/carnithine racemase
MKLGMVDELAEEEKLLPRAKEIVAKWYDNPGKAFGMLKLGLRRPVYDRMKYYLANSNWKEGFNCFFNPETRAAIDFVMKMMG